MTASLVKCLLPVHVQGLKGDPFTQSLSLIVRFSLKLLLLSRLPPYSHASNVLEDGKFLGQVRRLEEQSIHLRGISLFR